MEIFKKSACSECFRTDSFSAELFVVEKTFVFHIYIICLTESFSLTLSLTNHACLQIPSRGRIMFVSI